MNFIGESKERVQVLAKSKSAQIAGLGLLLAGTVTTSAYAAADGMPLLDVRSERQVMEVHDALTEDFLQRLDFHSDVQGNLTSELASEMLEGQGGQGFPVQVNDGGTIRICYSSSATVADFLKENRIEVGVEDRVTPSLTTMMVETTVIRITRVVRSVQIKTGSLENQEVVRKDSNLEIGKQRVLNPGKLGSYTENFAVVMENGKVISKVSMGRMIVSQPVDRIVVEGTKQVSREKAIDYAEQFLGTRYLWGGATPEGFDCSGYVAYVYANALGISLPRTAAAMYAAGKDVDEPRKGDLLFFSNGRGISHVGLYMGDGLFINSSSSKGVSMSSLENGYWHKRYVGAKSF